MQTNKPNYFCWIMKLYKFFPPSIRDNYVKLYPGIEYAYGKWRIGMISINNIHY